jgi:hypothetical protein
MHITASVFVKNNESVDSSVHSSVRRRDSRADRWLIQPSLRDCRNFFPCPPTLKRWAILANPVGIFRRAGARCRGIDRPKGAEIILFEIAERIQIAMCDKRAVKSARSNIVNRKMNNLPMAGFSRPFGTAATFFLVPPTLKRWAILTNPFGIFSAGGRNVSEGRDHGLSFVGAEDTMVSRTDVGDRRDSAVPSGLPQLFCYPPNVETLGYSRKSLRDFFGGRAQCREG